MKAAEYSQFTQADTAIVSTNSVCQGRIVALLWPLIFKTGASIHFAHTSFKWSNLASHNAGVTVAIVGLSSRPNVKKRIFSEDGNADLVAKDVDSISPYLTSGPTVIVEAARKSLSRLAEMAFGNMPVDGGYLLLTADEKEQLHLPREIEDELIVKALGSAEYIRGQTRYGLWIEDQNLKLARSFPAIADRIEKVREFRLASKDRGTREMASRSHQFREMYRARSHTIVLPGVSSEGREYLQVGLLNVRSTVTNLAFALYDAPLWNMALIASRLHLVWIGTVCGKLKTDFRYSNTLGWNTFPVPTLTEKNKTDLTACAEHILLAREAHFPATIADLYDPEKMPDNLRAAHDRNDETLERIYIGRRFRNDTERLEKLFEMYVRMTGKKARVSA